MIRVSCTDLDKYAAYLGDDDYPYDRLLAELKGQVPKTPAMERGHAFAKAMEHVGDNSDLLTAEGHAFAFTCNAEVEAWPRRELKAEKDYGGIVVAARCDRLHGNVIADDKTTSSFNKADPQGAGRGGFERYIDKWQWRFYLDIFGAQEFVWHIWECREIDVNKHGGPSDYPGIKAAWEVYNHHVIRNYRYPELENEVRDFAHEFRDFAERVNLYA